VFNSPHSISRSVPHDGYHYDGRFGLHGTRFFEGWYYRVTIPDINQSFAFMYAIDDPQGHTKFSGGSVQVLGIDDQHIWRSLPSSQDFFARRDRLELNHWNARGEGYAASQYYNRGKIANPTSKACTWDFQIKPINTWGNSQQPTMGLLSYLPIFEPGWQILMAHGLGQGFVDWDHRIYEFQNAPVYIEKNWGGAFPSKWFWLQCNTFTNLPGLTLTAAGGVRKFLGYPTDVAMIGIHYQDQFYEFMPGNSDIYCDVQPWGSWRMQASNLNGETVEIIGSTMDTGTWIMAPTELGLKFCCRDTTKGQIKVNLSSDRGVIMAESTQGALEIGGQGWEQAWQFKSAKF